MGSDGTGGALALRRPVSNEAEEDLHPQITRESHMFTYESTIWWWPRGARGSALLGVARGTAAMIGRV